MTKANNADVKSAAAMILAKAPDQSKIVETLVDRYRKAVKASSKNILDIAKTIYQVEKELGVIYKDAFYQTVELDPKGSTVRKLKKIGEEFTRFQPFLDKLPNTWTTLYELASMDKEDFARVVDAGVLHPCQLNGTSQTIFRWH